MESAGTILREARTRARLSQTDLAKRVGVAQSAISAYESGHRQPSMRTLQRLVAATGGRLVLTVEHGPATGLPGTPLGRRLRQRRQLLLAIAARHGATNVRVFGSVARGEDGPESDVDLLVDVPPRTGLYSLIAIQDEISDALGARVDLVSADDLKERVGRAAVRDAIPL